MKIVPLVSLEYNDQNGQRAETTPGAVFDTARASNLSDKDVKKLIDNGHAREPEEMELALYDRQNPEKVVTKDSAEIEAAKAPIKTQTEPDEPNGPGGASGVTDQVNSSVAADTNTVGAGSQGDEPTGEAAKKAAAKKKKDAENLA